MSKTQTIEEWENSARAAVQAQQDLIQGISQASATLETKLQKFATSPSAEGLAEAIRNEIELAARKALSERIKRNYRADDQLNSLLNTQAGSEVLKAFVEEKKKIIAELKKKIAPLRREALGKEESGDSEAAFDLNEKAAELVDLVKSYEGHLSTAEQALRRSDATTRYIEIRDQLHLIYA